MSTFTGFSEEDLVRIKSADSGSNNDLHTLSSQSNESNIRRLDKIGAKQKKPPQYKLSQLKQQTSDDAIDSITFEKCRLSLKSPTTPAADLIDNNNKEGVNKPVDGLSNDGSESKDLNKEFNEDPQNNNVEDSSYSRKSSVDVTPDIVRGATNYTEDELATHKVKLEELQLKQKLMEEQNKKRKEMLSKALADRTKQTEEQVMKLEKIKKELQVLDGQFTQDVAVLRKKIDQACLSFADAEKHYLKVENEFLQAKIKLQKEKEKKELLTEHLCALITHNETRKAKKLETLMLQLVDADKCDENEVSMAVDEEEPVIVDGVDERTGKMVEFSSDY